MGELLSESGAVVKVEYHDAGIAEAIKKALTGDVPVTSVRRTASCEFRIPKGEEEWQEGPKGKENCIIEVVSSGSSYTFHILSVRVDTSNAICFAKRHEWTPKSTLAGNGSCSRSRERV